MKSLVTRAQVGATIGAVRGIASSLPSRNGRGNSRQLSLAPLGAALLAALTDERFAAARSGVQETLTILATPEPVPAPSHRVLRAGAVLARKSVFLGTAAALGSAVTVYALAYRGELVSAAKARTAGVRGHAGRVRDQASTLASRLPNSTTEPQPAGQQA